FVHDAADGLHHLFDGAVFAGGQELHVIALDDDHAGHVDAGAAAAARAGAAFVAAGVAAAAGAEPVVDAHDRDQLDVAEFQRLADRSEEHTSELQSRENLV